MYTYLYCNELLQNEFVRNGLNLNGYEPQRVLMKLCREQNREFDYNPAVKHKSISWMVMALINWIRSESGSDFWCDFHCDLEDVGL